jgi:MoaA/NifB/PqqE/SkfB family radical SAM enzyme
MANYNQNMDFEAHTEYKRILDELKNSRCRQGTSKTNLSIANRMLNSQERFDSVYCFSHPLNLQIELTNECNLKCIQCGVIKRKKATLPISIFQKIWKTLPYLEGIAWLGGEVFLVDYFLELLRTIQLEFPHISHTIYTNGLLIDQKIAPVLSDIANLQIKFSIDSVVRETYEQIRAEGKFEILLNNLLAINEAYKQKGKKPNLGINVIVMKKNIEQLILYPDFCKKYGITHLDISFLADDADPPLLPEENIFSGAEQAVLKRVKSILLEIETKCHEYGTHFYCNFDSSLKRIDDPAADDADIRRAHNSTIITERKKGILLEIETKCHEYGTHFYCNFDSSLKRIDDPAADDADIRRAHNSTIMAERTKNELSHVFQCYYPWTSLFIKCSGLVVPTGDCTIPVGNILKDDLSDIWNGQVMQTYRYKLAHSDLSKWCSHHCQQKVKVNKLLLDMSSEGPLSHTK